MIQPFSFGVGAVSTLFLWKFTKVLYRLYPYLLKSQQLQSSAGNERIIIAGGTDGIGLEYVRLLSKSYHVLVIGRNIKKLQQLQKLSSNISISVLDFNKNSLRNEVILQQISKLTNSQSNVQVKVKGVINCVGVGQFQKYENISFDSIHKINQTNIESLHFMLKIMHAARKQELLTQSPFFINLSSAAAEYPNKYSAVYAATKAYISHLIRAVEMEESNVTYLDLRPWYVKTKMVGFLDTWDTVHPEEIAKGSFKLLGRRSSGCGCPKHELIQQFHSLFHPVISSRIEKLMSKIQRISALRRKGKE